MTGNCLLHATRSIWEISRSSTRTSSVDDEPPPLIDDEEPREVPIFDITGRTTRHLMRPIARRGVVDEDDDEAVDRIRRREDAETSDWFEARSIPCPSQAAEAASISRILNVPIGQRQTYAIPKIIHRFWTGGPMRPGAFRHLFDDGEIARRAGWRCYLWYSTTVEDAVDTVLPEERRFLRQSQRDSLELAGYEIGFVEGLAPGARRGALQDVTEETVVKYAQVAAQAVVRHRNYDVVKYFSDFARLLYLHALGGFHIDVDMRLGDMDLTATYHHNDLAGEVPLLGTLARDSSNVDVVRRLRALKTWRDRGSAPQEGYLEAVTFLANAAMMGAGMYNGLIATRAATQHVRLAIREFQVRANKMLKTGDLPTAMGLQPIFLCGAGDGRNRNLAMCESVPPYVLRLDQVTDESDIGAGLRR